MAVGLGARKSNADTKYFVSADQDSYVSGGIATGGVAVRSPFAGNGGGGDLGWDGVNLWVWGITGAALAIVLGVHFAFGPIRI